MSIIFPTEPAKVNIHLLPKNVGIVSYNVQDTITVSAWMPNGFEHIHQENHMNNDDFHHNFCDGCERNCYEFLNAYLMDDEDDDSDEVDWSHPDLQNHCNVYDEGYHGQTCPLGNTKEDEDVDFDVSNMVFKVQLSHLGELPRFRYIKDSAYLQAGFLSEPDEEEVSDGRVIITATPRRMAANVFGYEEYPEGICWGYNLRPTNLREVVTNYFNTPFNNDLTSLDCFADNCNIIRDYSNRLIRISPSNVPSGEEYLCHNADALMLLDAETNIPAFFTMLMAGYETLPKAPHIFMIPLYETEFERDGSQYRGFKTKPDAVGKEWFIYSNSQNAGVLVGQI